VRIVSGLAHKTTVTDARKKPGQRTRYGLKSHPLRAPRNQKICLQHVSLLIPLGVLRCPSWSSDKNRRIVQSTCANAKGRSGQAQIRGSYSSSFTGISLSVFQCRISVPSARFFTTSNHPARFCSYATADDRIAGKSNAGQIAAINLYASEAAGIRL